MTAQGEGLLAWLESAITLRDQVARLAQKGAEGRWHSGGDPDDRDADEFEFKATHVADDQGRLVVYNEVHPSKAQSVHIALNDPESVLRRCAADRKLLDEHAPQQDGSGFPDSMQCRTCSQSGGDGYQYLVPFPCATVRALAEGYGWTGGEQ